MRLVLLRHGIAEESGGGSDAERSLTAEGRKKAQEVCRALAGMDLGIDRVLSSPLARALETAGILRDALKLTKAPEVSKVLLPESKPQDATEVIQSLKASCVALVGHEPHLSHYAAWCIGGGAFELRKSGVMVLEGPGLPGAGAGALVGMFAPRHLRPLV